ncbi:MAG TPA: PAS domain-containing protein [Pseudolabrys sp.]|nr:PAS domain-containing protein [Pseudolabrys sp.]
MKFVVARPDVVRAINQRWLLKFWMRHLEGNAVPPWAAVEATDFSRMSDNLSFLDVVGTGSGLGFQIRAHGALIAQVYGSADCRGKQLENVIPASRHQEGLAPYFHTVAAVSPVYTVHDVSDREGRVVHYERLLLPFARNGKTVDRILASFECVCIDGRFEGQALMRQPNAAPALRLSARIEAREMAWTSNCRR